RRPRTTEGRGGRVTRDERPPQGRGEPAWEATVRGIRRFALLLIVGVGLGGCGLGKGGSDGGSSGSPAGSIAWSSKDIGIVGFAGSTSGSSPSFQVTASGGDIWDSADGFLFVYTPLFGDGDILA